VRGTDNALYAISFDPESDFSTGFQPLEGIVVSNPSCTSDFLSSPRIVCGVVGADNALYAIGFETALPGIRTASSTGYERLGGIVADDPSCGVAQAQFNAMCAVKGMDNSLQSIDVDPGVAGGVSDFQFVASRIFGSPSCVGHFRGGGGLFCGARAVDNSLFGVFSSRTSGPFALSGLIENVAMLGNPSCTGGSSSAGLRFFCLVVGANAGNGLFGIELKSGLLPGDPILAPVGDAVAFGGVVVGTPSCATDVVGDPDVRVQIVPEVMCAVKGTDNALYGILVFSLVRFR
jgi:hypothetical protein